MNAGLPIMVSAKKYQANPPMADWLKYVAGELRRSGDEPQGHHLRPPGRDPARDPAADDKARRRPDQGGQAAAGLVRVVDVGQGPGRGAEERGGPGERQCLAG